MAQRGYFHRIRGSHTDTTDENRRVRLNYELLEPMFDPCEDYLRIEFRQVEASSGGR